MSKAEPQVIHRFSTPLHEIASAVSGRSDFAPDSISARVDGDNLIIDLPEEKKGGKRAQRAAMLAQDGSFQKWLEVGSADDATFEIKNECQVASRVDLDHDEEAGAKFDEIVKRYDLWLQGYD